MAIAFSKTGRHDEAVRCYRKALELQPKLSGAHYGLAFLLIKKGEIEGRSEHLEAFLREPPSGAESERWVRHAQRAGRSALGSGRGPRTDRAVAVGHVLAVVSQKVAWEDDDLRQPCCGVRSPRLKTLVVDVDPQGAVRYGVGLKRATPHGFSDYLNGARGLRESFSRRRSRGFASCWRVR
jgi:tetratricopeptide (TPR) repeat protein